MTRAIDDATSRCGTCRYWTHDPTADGIHPTRLGHCNYLSIPGWAQKALPKNFSTRMREDGGETCWLHDMRPAQNSVEKP